MPIATMAIEIISHHQEIKPSKPTPHHLKSFKGSLLDLLNPHSYVPFVFFYNNNQNSSKPENIIFERSQILKRSLSETLSRFYPIAGKIKDNLHIDCNDEGVYYIEARVDQNLSDFLTKPDNKMIHKLLPFHPTTSNLSAKYSYLIMVQVNFFLCGGIAIGLYMSHQLIDGQSLATFLKAWAGSARDPSKQIDPTFVSTALFHPTLSKEALVVRPYPLDVNKSTTRRFVFSASCLSCLKEKASAHKSSSPSTGPTRVTSVMALIWKCTIKASQKRLGGQKNHSVTLTSVNLRPRTSPPLPSNSIGNIFWHAIAECKKNDDIELHSLVPTIRESINRVDNNFVEQIKGKDGPQRAAKFLAEFGKVFANNDTEFYISSSLCNIGFYEADFGWGKPVWVSIGYADADVPDFRNLVHLIETRSGDGIEAWVTLSEHDMAIFEKDPELLTYATLNPNPLENLK